MDVHDCDDRWVCESHDEPSYFVEQWRWRVKEDGHTRWAFTCDTFVLNDCDVHEALEWARTNQADLGCFVLHAATGTSHGFLETCWLTGKAPGEQRSSPSKYVRLAE